MAPGNVNTPGLGIEYEVHVPAYFSLLLNSSPDIEDFRLRPNVQEFGNLDDLLIDIETKGSGNLYFGFQLKHKDKSEKHLLPTNFEAKGDFNLEKYCEAFKKLSEENRKKYHFILYTNKNFDSSRSSEVKNFCMKATQDVCCFGKSFFDTSGGDNNLYKFKVNEKTQEGKNVNKEDYRKFFSKFSLYTGQANARDIEKSILDILKYKVCFATYINFFRKWHRGDFIDKILDKKTLNVHLLDILLSSVKINYHLSDGQNKNSIFFEEMVQQFDITIIDTSKQEFIKQLEVQIFKYPKAFNNSSEEITKLGKNKKFIDRFAKELKHETKKKLLHYFYSKFIEELKENVQEYLKEIDINSEDYMLQFVKDDNKFTEELREETKLNLLHYFYQKFIKQLIENVQKYPEEFNKSLEEYNKDSTKYKILVKDKKFIEEVTKGTELKLLRDFYQKFIKRLKENFLEYLEDFHKNSEEYMIKFVKDDNKCTEKLKGEKKLKLLQDFHQKFITELKEDVLKYLKEFDKISEDYMLQFVKNDNKFMEKLREETKLKLLHYFYQKPIILNYNESSKDLIYEATKICKIQECEIKLVILGQNIDESKFSHLKIFTNLTGVDGDILEETKRRCKLSLQGRNISFEEIFEDEIREFVTPREIFQMLKGCFSIGEDKEKLPECYIPRTVSTTVFDIESIIKHSFGSNAIIFYYKDKFEELKILIKNIVNRGNYLYEEFLDAIILDKKEALKRQSSQNDPRDTFPEIPTIILRKEELSRLKFEEICKKIEKDDIRFFKLIDEKRCLLLMSTKDTSFKETYNFSKTFVEEKNIHVFFNNSINIVCAQPGMGKSSLMKYLKNQCDPNLWTVMVDLKAHNYFLKRTHKIEKVLNYFLHLKTCEDRFLLNIKEMFVRKKNIVLFLDGLDEVEIECVDYVLNITRELSEMGFRIWLSSRQSLQQKLEQYFNIFSLEIKELNQDQQKNYIENRLMSLYKKNEIEEIVEKIFSNTNLANNRQILEIPLQLQIITQIFIDDKSHYSNLSKNNFSLTKMLEIFFHGKYKHYLAKIESKYTHLLGKLEEQLENYKIVALHSVLDDEHFQKLQIERFKLTQIKNSDFLGIITKINRENKAVFVHLTFAEYFAAKFLVKNFDKARILKEDIFARKYQNLLLIFNIMLAEDNPLHLAIIYKDFSRIQEMKESSLMDKGGRNFLQVAACVATRHPLLDFTRDVRFSHTNCFLNKLPSSKYKECLVKDFPVQQFKGEDQKIKEIINRIPLRPFENDKIFEWNSLDYALVNGALYIVEAILEKSEKPPNFYKTLGKYYSDEVVAYYSIRFGYHRLLSKILVKKSCHMTGIVSDYLRHVKGKSILHFLFLESDCMNRTRIVELLTGNNISKTVFVENGHTFLHFAVFHKDTELVKFLLEKGANINVKDKKGWSPLFWAVKRNNLEISKLIIKKGANVNIKDKENGRTPLFWAVERNNFEISKLLVDIGADVNIRDKENGMSPLFDAVEQDNFEISKLLLEKGAKIDLRTKQNKNKTPLASVLTPISKKANNNKSKKISSLLRVAAKRGNFNLVQILIENGASWNEETFFDAVYGGNNQVVDLFLEKGLDLSNLNDALHRIIKCDNLYVINYLIDHGADVNLFQNFTILYKASLWGHAKTVEALLNNPKIAHLLFVPNKVGTTCLHLAVYFGRVEVVELILKMEIDLDKFNIHNDKYPLHFAAVDGRLQKELLIKMTRVVKKLRTTKNHYNIEEVVNYLEDHPVISNYPAELRKNEERNKNLL